MESKLGPFRRVTGPFVGEGQFAGGLAPIRLPQAPGERKSPEWRVHGQGLEIVRAVRLSLPAAEETCHSLRSTAIGSPGWRGGRDKHATTATAVRIPQPHEGAWDP